LIVKQVNVYMEREEVTHLENEADERREAVCFKGGVKHFVIFNLELANGRDKVTTDEESVLKEG